MSRRLLPYQVPAWQYARTRDRIALFMKMRLGKSIITIRWAQHRLPSDANILIIAPLSVLTGWLDELALEGERGTILHGTSRQKIAALENCQTRWVLTNPEAFCARRKKKGEPKLPMSEAAKALTSIDWDCVILDESTFIANPKSAVTQLIRKEFKNVRCKAILAGEPAPEHDLMFFEQMAFLFDVFMGCRTFYQFKYRNYHRLGWEWEPRVRGFKKRLRDEIRRLAFVLSEREAGVEFNSIYQRRYVRLPDDAWKKYRDCRRQFATSDVETKWSVVLVGWLTRMAGGCLPTKGTTEPFSTHKIDELEYLVCERFSGESLVVWFRYTDEIRFCAERLRRRGIRLHCINGKTPIVLRQAYRKAFQSKRVQVMLVQSKCARFGLDLSAANTAIYYSNWWDWLTRAQSEARIKHPTKVGSTLLYIDLLTERTEDEAVLEVLKGKKTNSRYFLQKVMVKYAALSRSRRQDNGHVHVSTRAPF